MIKRMKFSTLSVCVCSAIFASHVVALPDLKVDKTRLEYDGTLYVQIGNVGPDDAPGGVGMLSVFVDHILAAKIDLTTDMPNQDFRTAGMSTEVSTGIRLHGRHRRIAVFVDSDNEIEERVEVANFLSVDVPTSVRTGFDLAIEAVLNSNDEISFVLRNAGNLPTPNLLPISIEVYADEILLGTANEQIQSVPVGAMTTITPSTAIVIPAPPQLVRVTIVPPSWRDLDSLNDSFQAEMRNVSLSDVAAKYGALLGDPDVSAALIWYTASNGTRNYANWPVAWKDHLDGYLQLLEQGRELPIYGPPDLTYIDCVAGEPLCVGRVLEPDAQNLYMANAAHTLWFDVNAFDLFGVSWSLSDLSTDELGELHLTYRNLLSFTGELPDGTGYYTPRIECSWNPRVLFHFLQSFGMIRETQSDTAFALADWFRAYTQHGTREAILESFDYPRDWLDHIFYPWWGTEAAPGGRSHSSRNGCWTTTPSFMIAARAVNIPAIYGRGNWGGGTHSNVDLPTVNRTPVEAPGIRLRHSDDFYATSTSYGYPYYIPTELTNEDLFFSYDEADLLLENIPQPYDCNPSPSNCNLEKDQRTYNGARRQLLTAWNKTPTYWLMKYHDDVVNGTNGLDVSTQGTFPFPYLSPTELSAFKADLTAKLVELGGSVAGGGQFLLQQGGVTRPGGLRHVEATDANATPVVKAWSPLFSYTDSLTALIGYAIDGDGPSPLMTIWSCDSQAVTIADPNAISTTMSGPEGSYVCTLTVSDGVNMNAASVAISMVAPVGSMSVIAWNEGSRYLAISPWASAPGDTIAIRITSNDSTVGCIDMYLQDDCTLGDGPPMDDPNTQDNYHTVDAWLANCGRAMLPLIISSEMIVPGTMYTVEVKSSVDGAYSSPATATTWIRGDVFGDGAADFIDISAVNNAFLAIPPYTFEILLPFDIAALSACELDGEVDFKDIQEAVAAFLGDPFTCPSGAPLTCCANDLACDDNFYCNGAEECSGGQCIPMSPPCTDNGLFCDGSESCDELNEQCVSSGDPCGAGEVCNEATDTCDAEDNCQTCNNACCGTTCCQFGFQICCNGVCSYPSSPQCIQ